MKKQRYNRLKAKRKRRGKCKLERRYSKVKGESRNAVRSGDVDMAREMTKRFFGIKERDLESLLEGERHGK